MQFAPSGERTSIPARATLRQDCDEPHPEADKLLIRPTRQPGPVSAARTDKSQLRAPSAGPISFWVTSLPPAPVSDDASRNRWIQTHSQFSRAVDSPSVKPSVHLQGVRRPRSSSSLVATGTDPAHSTYQE
jgi:hypothetical protein